MKTILTITLILLSTTIYAQSQNITNSIPSDLHCAITRTKSLTSGGGSTSVAIGMSCVSKISMKKDQLEVKKLELEIALLEKSLKKK